MHKFPKILSNHNALGKSAGEDSDPHKNEIILDPKENDKKPEDDP